MYVEKIKMKGFEDTMKQIELNGIIVPILTPMNEDESINLEELRAQVERMIENGIHGIFPFGTNGEGYILTGRHGFFASYEAFIRHRVRRRLW